MADATAVLVMEARDRASAQLKAFGANVQAAGKQAEGAAVGVAKTGAATESMIARMKAAQTPLRNLSAILSGFGLSFLGITAATMAVRQMAGAIIQNQQGIIAGQVNLRRWGLTMDDATRLTSQFSAILGRTSGATLAGFTKDMADFLFSFAPAQRANILRWAKDIEIATGGLIPASESIKQLMEDEILLGEGKGMKNFKERAAGARAEVSELSTSYERGMDVITTALETLGTGFVQAFDPEFHKKAFKEIGDVFKDFGTWVRDDWAKGFEIDMSAPIPRAVQFIKDSWQPMTDLFIDWAKWLHGWFTTRWEMLVAKGAEIWAGFLGFWVQLGNNIVNWGVAAWGRFGEWWAGFVGGIGDFWNATWNGMRSVALGVYNWIVDRLNAAIGFINSAIAAYNASIFGKFASVSAIALQFQHGTLGESITAPAPTFSAPPLTAAPGGTIIIPVTIGERTIAEIIVDTLTGAVRQRELPT